VNIAGFVTIEALLHTVVLGSPDKVASDDGGRGFSGTPTPSPPTTVNLPGVMRDSAITLRNSKDEEIGRERGNVSTEEAP
jgi:hypothetical protein